MSALDEFKKMLQEAAAQGKIQQPEPVKVEQKENTNPIENLAASIGNKKKIAEQQDSLAPLDQKFVTLDAFNKHYNDFLLKIQQQLSSLGGGGEVNLRGLDDVATSTTGTNKFLTYNPSTRKFYFDYISAGAGFSLTDGVLGLNAGPMFELDESDTFQLKAGTADRIGGIKAGPGVAIDPNGTLFIDSAGLPFTFGDFTGLVGTYTSNTEYALLSSVNEDEDIVIASNGDGGIKAVGEFRVYAPNGTVTAALEDSDPFFQVKGDGQVQILVPLADTTEGGVEIIGSDLGTSLQPGIAGTMLHMTGNADLPTRVYHDTLGGYSSYVFRRYNGSAASPTQVLADEAVARINFTAATDAGMGNVAFAQIRVQALEDQTTTAQGSEIQFFVTPEGDIASNRIAALEVRAAGVTSDVGFIGDLTGNADTVTNGVYTTDTGTVTNTMLANSTISGVALGSNLADLTAGTYLTTDGTYNGGTARTFAVDATTAATADKVVARDSNGAIAATGTILATRQAGSFGAGQTITVDMATDKYVHATITAATVTIAYTNITPGKEVMLFLTNPTGDDLAVNSGLSTTNCTNAKAVENVKKGGTSRFEAVSFGTSTATMYGNWEK
jgi:hypothetical protein